MKKEKGWSLVTKKPPFFLNPFSFCLDLLAWPWRAVRWLLLVRPIHITRFGYLYIFFSLAVGAAAINTGNNLLYLVLGLLLGFIIVSGFLSDSGLWGLEATFQTLGDFYAGQPAEWEIRARKSWFPAILVYVEAFWNPPPETTNGEGTRHLFYWVPRHGTQTLRASFTPRRRGLLHLQRLRYTTRFPFGLFEKSHQEFTGQSWVVFPRVQRLPLEVLRVAGEALSDQPAAHKGFGTTPFDLRDYRAGDASKRIHWKSSAKRGRLMVTEMEEESDQRQLVFVSAWPVSNDPDAVELFISFLASLVFTLHQQGRGVGLVTPGADFAADSSRAQLKKILTYLALVDPVQESARPFPKAQRPGHGIDALALWERFPSIR